MAGGRIRELLNKYGKVGAVVHYSVSAISISGLYLAMKHKLLAGFMCEKISIHEPQSNSEMTNPYNVVVNGNKGTVEIAVSSNGILKSHRTVELGVSSGGALIAALLCNKLLSPIRVPVTLWLTPRVARFLARHQFIKNSE